MSFLNIKYDDEYYIAEYNQNTGYYEIEIQAKIAGVHTAEIIYKDILNNTYKEEKKIQVFQKEKVKFLLEKTLMYIFDWKDFKMKDILEISNYEINIDEETNANSLIQVLKKSTAVANDIIAIKKNNNIIYWGVIKDISNEDGKQLYEYTTKYITNMFDEEVSLNENVNDDELEDGAYKIKCAVDLKKNIDVQGNSSLNEANIYLWENNDTYAQKFKITKQTDGFYTINHIGTDKYIDLKNGTIANGTNIQQYVGNNSSSQRWKFQHVSGSSYKIKNKASDSFCIDIEGGSPTEGTNIQLYQENNTKAQTFFLARLEEEIIKDKGIEDFLAKAINDNFINGKDTFSNRKYLEVRVKTHTKINTTVSNVNDGIYNLFTWMTNCTQKYNINYNIFEEDTKLIIEIENKSEDKRLIDVKAQPISNYNEVFQTDIISKVEVLTSTDTYYLYLLTDRTTTTDKNNPNRAEGKTKRLYRENIEDARQAALDVIMSNSYNHNITFNLYEEYIKVGTPIAIKTKKSIILNTYISSVKITKDKFIEYVCGNIRIKFIDKLLKERNN